MQYCRHQYKEVVLYIQAPPTLSLSAAITLRRLILRSTRPPRRSLPSNLTIATICLLIARNLVPHFFTTQHCFRLGNAPLVLLTFPNSQLHYTSFKNPTAPLAPQPLLLDPCWMGCYGVWIIKDKEILPDRGDWDVGIAKNSKRKTLKSTRKAQAEHKRKCTGREKEARKSRYHEQTQ